MRKSLDYSAIDCKIVRLAASFEELDFPLMFDGGRSSREGAEVPPFPCLGIFLTGVEPISP
jgi:hypothetical protein